MPNQVESTPAAIAFQYTEQMREWIESRNGTFAGDFCVFDAWTYGQVEVNVVNGKWSTMRFATHKGCL